MGSMFFGQYLLSKGAINREALIEAIERAEVAGPGFVNMPGHTGEADFKPQNPHLGR